MTKRINTISDYGQLSARFGVVRRAWKRAAMLSGLAIVITESIGIFTALLFLDWLYQPLPIIRVGVVVVALGVIAWLLVRHVVKPMLRKIPDEQIALYIEENRTELDGVLITAAEFGRKRDQIAGNQLVLIDAVVHEAAARVARTQVNHMVDFSRLRKYGLGAIVGIGLYLLLSVLFPGAFTHHLARVLQPWHATNEDLNRNAVITAQAQPLQFTFSKGDSSLPRGSSFDFEVTLSKSKPTDQAVVMFFRPKTTGAAWQKLAMSEIEKLNSFQGTLPDVSEDLEFYVACGADKSDSHKLSVYDPLIVQSLEMTTHFPDYIKQPDRVEKPSTGDVTALIGSTATLKIAASTPLKSGQIKWNDGHTQELAIDPQGIATVSFDVKQDGTYDYTLTDVNGQQAVSPAPLSVHAIPDLPPTIAVKSPMSPVLTHMLGEVNFEVEADDDFGVTGVELVYSRLDPQGVPKETRLPLKSVAQNTASAHSVTATHHLMLENIQPPFQDNETLTYHIEARDAKGQVAISNLGFVIVGYFEHWATYAPPESVNDTQAAPADLMAVVAMIWELNNQKAHLSPADLKKQSQDIIAKMVDEQGRMINFITPLQLIDAPKLAQVTKPIADHVKKAHDALVATDTATATAEINVAAALFTGYSVNQDSSLLTASGTAMGDHYKPPALTMLEQARLDALAAAEKDKTVEEKDKAQSEAAAAAAKQVADLVAKQDDLVKKAQALPTGDQPPANGTPKKDATQTGDAKPPAANSPAAQKLAADIAAAQHEVAEQTRAAAAQAQVKAAGARDGQKLQAAAEKTAAAAKMMEEAARAFAAGKTGEAQAKAGQAKETLQEAGTTLQTNDRDKLAAAIGNAESSVAVLLDKQKDLADQTQKLAKDIGDKPPDQRQQRDLQKQAYQQTQLGAQVEALNDKLNDLNQRATQVGEAEAIRALNDAQHALKRGQPQAKIAGAVVDLNNGKAADAANGQAKAADTLQKVVEKLQAGSDALAVSREAQLNRANRVAQNVKKGLEELAAKANDPHAAQPKPEAGGDDKDTARKVGHQLAQLVNAVDNRQLLPQDQVDQLKKLNLGTNDLESKLETDPKFRNDTAEIVARISNKIEAEMEAKTEASKLFSSQREECPPGYRQLVNKYFEALSKIAPAPNAAAQPAQP